MPSSVCRYHVSHDVCNHTYCTSFASAALLHTHAICITIPPPHIAQCNTSSLLGNHHISHHWCMLNWRVTSQYHQLYSRLSAMSWHWSYWHGWTWRTSQPAPHGRGRRTVLAQQLGECPESVRTITQNILADCLEINDELMAMLARRGFNPDALREAWAPPPAPEPESETNAQLLKRTQLARLQTAKLVRLARQAGTGGTPEPDVGPMPADAHDAAEMTAARQELSALTDELAALQAELDAAR